MVTIHGISRGRSAARRNLIEMIRRWQALPPHKRTHFLCKRVRPGGSAL